MGFSKQENWSGWPFPSPGDLPDPEIEPMSPALAGGFLTTVPTGRPLRVICMFILKYTDCIFISKGKHGYAKVAQILKTVENGLRLGCSAVVLFVQRGSSADKEDSAKVGTLSRLLSLAASLLLSLLPSFPSPAAPRTPSASSRTGRTGGEQDTVLALKLPLAWPHDRHVKEQLLFSTVSLDGLACEVP